MKLDEKKRSNVASAFIDGSFFIGAGLLTWGAHLAYAPAGFIVPGLLLLGVGIVGIAGARR